MKNRRNIVFGIAVTVLLGLFIYGFAGNGGGVIAPKDDGPSEEELTLFDEVDFPAEIIYTYEQRIAIAESAIAARDSVDDVDSFLIFATATDADFLGDNVKAKSLYEDYLQVSPTDFTALANYAGLTARMGYLDLAEETYQHILEIAPTEDDINRYIRFLKFHYHDGSRDDDIRRLYERAIDLFGQREWLMLGLAEWYEEHDDCKAAIDHYEVALQLNPANESTQKDLDKTRSQCN